MPCVCSFMTVPVSVYVTVCCFLILPSFFFCGSGLCLVRFARRRLSVCLEMDGRWIEEAFLVV